jgi:hypothetical protein
MKAGFKSITVAVAATGALLAAGGAPASGAPHAKSVLVSTPTLTITMGKAATKGDPDIFKVSGTRTFSAGRVNLVLHAKRGEQEFAIVRLHSGYTLADLYRDFNTFFMHQDNPTPAAMKAINRIVRRSTFYGGIDSGTGHKTVSASVVLPKAGTYYVADDNGGPGQGPRPVKLRVTAKQGYRTAPTVAAVQRATTSKQFRGTTNLPASGTIEFKDASTNSPHFLNLLHVKAGTTRKQVIKALQCNGPKCSPPPFLNGSVGTDALFMGRTQTLTYTLPAGDYAELCFFPDLKTGMPHALMGMVRIVHLS